MKTALLKEICIITMGQAPPGSSYNDAGEGLPLIAGASDFGEMTPEPTRYTKVASKISSCGDIILCIRATIGDRNWSNREYCLGRGVAGLKVNSNKLDSSYLWHWLSTAQDTLIKQARGSTFKQVDKQTIENLEIPLPPLEEQRRLAAILNKADTVRKKRQQAIQLTEDLLRAAFLEMFGDPITNPKEWEVVNLGEHLSFVTTGPRGWAEYYSNIGERFIRSLDVRMNSILENDAVYVNAPNNAEAKRARVENGDVLLTMTGSRIGRVAPVPKDFGTAYISQHVAILRPRPTISPQYLSFYLSTPSGGQRQIAGMQYGQTKPGLNLNQVSSFQVPLPPIEKQQDFDAFWLQYQATLNNQRTALTGSKNLFNSLIHCAFRGEL